MKKLFVIMVAIAMALGLSSLANAAPTLVFDIDFGMDGSYDTGTTYDMMLGDSVDIGLYVSGLSGPGDGVAGMGFDLSFDGGQLVASNLGIALPFMDAGGSGITSGHVLADAIAWPPGTFVGGDDILLATFTLTCTEVGLSDLLLGDFSTDLNHWITENGDILDGQLNGINLGSINNVPIPGAVWLLGSGLLGLIGLRRKMKA